MKNKKLRELPIIGSGHSFGKDPLKFYDDLREISDQVPYHLLGTKFLAIYGPQDIEQVLTKNAGNYQKSIFVKKKWNDYLGQGLISADGAVWKKSRKILQPFMNRDKFDKNFQIVFQEIRSMIEKVGPNQVVDTHEFSMRLMLFSLVRMLFSSSLKDTEIERLGHLFAECISYFNYTLTPAGMMLERLPTPRKKRYFKAIEELNNLIFALIEGPDSGQGNMLSALKEARDEEGQPLATELIRDQILTFFLAGHETSALTINYVLYLLAQYPEELRKVQAELDETPESMEGFEGLKHLKNVINETFRLYPPVSVIAREAIREDLIGDFKVNPGMNITIPVCSVHRDPRWYKDPNAFKPERWEDPALLRTKGIFLPFGSGPRMCIGAGLSMMKITTVLAVILKKYDLSLKSDPRLEFVVSLTTRPKERILIEFSERKTQSDKKAA